MKPTRDKNISCSQKSTFWGVENICAKHTSLTVHYATNDTDQGTKIIFLYLSRLSPLLWKHIDYSSLHGLDNKKAMSQLKDLSETSALINKLSQTGKIDCFTLLICVF